jgi:prepilin signal peptidase PulO-like enzyme (type II secretory pathway)
MLGAFLGPYAALEGFSGAFFGALVGALVGGVLMAVGRIRRGSALTFGVFLALGGILTLFMGQEVWDWYWMLVRVA